VTDLAPVEAISMLYRAILGREADEFGLAGWSARVESGEPLLALAHELAGSDEALGRPSEHRAQVLADLIVWEGVGSLMELGVAAWHPERIYSPRNIAHEIFVGALFEVALQRQPTPDEAAFEIEKLVGGTGREWLIRAYAARPEVRSRLLGKTPPGLRGRLRHWRDGRRHVETFRALTAAAEARQVSHFLASLSTAGPALQDLVRAKPTTIEGR
jgi:hypothetical protein